MIQGLTDNLRGGAPGAVGKNLFHSVGRGLFVLKEVAGANVAFQSRLESVRHKAASQASLKTSHENQQTPGRNVPALSIASYQFRFVCFIDPLRTEDGAIQQFMPQDRYDNVQALPLSKYGSGPFCKFKIPWELTPSGVYAFSIGGEVQYIGECENLGRRFNMGYGNISPRNCFAGGQDTNCRINHLIFKEASKGSKIALWFHETADYKQVEAELRSTRAFPWNRV